MNEDVMKGKWNEIKGIIKQQWGKLTDDDIMRTDGNREELLGLLQKSYGYSRETAEQEYEKFMSHYEEQPRASK